MKLSIITVCRNDKKGLTDTIHSVLSQDTLEYEFIVIDGASTDGTTEILEQYKESIDYYISEPDKGIYNAMNKGICHAHGEYCLFLNAGDIFFDTNVISQFNANGINKDILSGKEICSFDGAKYVAFRNPPYTVNIAYFMDQTLAHQSTFIRTELLKKYPYDESYKIASDYILFFKYLMLYNASYGRLDFFVSKFVMNGISSTDGDLSMKERNRFLQSIFSEKILSDLKSYTAYKELVTHIESKSVVGFVLRSIFKLIRYSHILKEKFVIYRINAKK